MNGTVEINNFLKLPKSRFSWDCHKTPHHVMMAIKQQLYYFILSFNYVIARSMLIEFLDCLMVLKIIFWHFSPCSSEVLPNDTRIHMLHLPFLVCFSFHWSGSFLNADMVQLCLWPQVTEQCGISAITPCPLTPLSSHLNPFVQILVLLIQPSCFQLDFIKLCKTSLRTPQILAGSGPGPTGN